MMGRQPLSLLDTDPAPALGRIGTGCRRTVYATCTQSGTTLAASWPYEKLPYLCVEVHMSLH